MWGRWNGKGKILERELNTANSSRRRAGLGTPKPPTPHYSAHSLGLTQGRKWATSRKQVQRERTPHEKVGIPARLSGRGWGKA